MPHYRIAGFAIELSMPEWMIAEPFQKFAHSVNSPDLTVEAVFAAPPAPPESALPLISTEGQKIYSYQDKTCFLYGPDDSIHHMEVDADYSRCKMILNPGYNHLKSFAGNIPDSISANIRKIIMGKLALGNGLLLHSSVIRWDGKGVLFSAPSGTGKSTHAHLWQELYPDVDILNGDNGICRITGDAARVYGSPWCGTSGEYINDDLPIAGIVFLEQAKENSIIRLDMAEAVIRLSARCILPFWDPALIERNMDTVERFANITDFRLLRCRPDHEAVKLVKECIMK